MNKKLYDYVNKLYLEQKKKPMFENFLKPIIVDIDEGYVEVELTVREEHLNLHGITHGGILASLADLAMGITCISYGKSVVTTDMNLSYIRNVTLGKTIIAKAKVDKNGKNLMRTSCSIFDEEDNLLVKSMSTYFVVGKLNIN